MDRAGGKTFPAKTLRGQPMVILVAPSPDAKALRKEAGRIQDMYLQFAARKTVFFAAFTAQTGRVESNVPYAIAQNGAAVAAAYGVKPSDFAVIVVGPDGNVDMVSDEGRRRATDPRHHQQQRPDAGGTRCREGGRSAGALTERSVSRPSGRPPAARRIAAAASPARNTDVPATITFAPCSRASLRRVAR